MKKFDAKNTFLTKYSFVNLTIFFSCLLLNTDFACATIVHKQYRYIGHVHEEVSGQKLFLVK